VSGSPDVTTVCEVQRTRGDRPRQNLVVDPVGILPSARTTVRRTGANVRSVLGSLSKGERAIMVGAIVESLKTLSVREEKFEGAFARWASRTIGINKDGVCPMV
jgi:hypothetical protein